MLLAGVAALAIWLRISLNDWFFAPGFRMTNPVFRPEVRLWFAGVFTTVPVLLVSFFYQLLRNRYRTERQYLSLINSHNEARLQFLKAQINPHFLFNTLNNIYSLSLVKSDQTPQMILLLADLLRYVIYESQHEKVALEKEVIHLQKFIALFQMRHETPVNIRFETTGNAEHWEIEPMILIPLVENCFKHCDFDTNPQAFVSISLQTNQEELTFKTRNSCSWQPSQKDETGGVGLENIRSRLALQQPQQSWLDISQTPFTFDVSLIWKK